MSTLYLIVVLLIHLGSFESSTFHCDSDSLCSSVNHCASNESCLIICDGSNVCENKTFNCPSNAPCIIHCGTNISDKYSCQRTIFNTESDTEFINITTRGINSMQYSTTFCPSNNNNCFIYSLDGQSQLSNINIYAAKSFNDIYIQCKNRNCYDSLNFPTIYCSDYSSSCDIELQNIETETNSIVNSNKSGTFNLWQCTSNTASFSICNSISIINNSFISTTLANTFIFDGNMIEEAVENNRNNEAVIIGGILGAITFVLFLVIFIMATYLKLNVNKKSTKLKSIAVINTNTNKKELERLGSKSTSIKTPTSLSDTCNNSRFINKRRASNLPKPKPRNNDYSPTPDVDICDFST